METFTELFGSLLAFVYHGFDRIVIQGSAAADTAGARGPFLVTCTGLIPSPSRFWPTGPANTSSGWKLTRATTAFPSIGPTPT